MTVIAKISIKNAFILIGDSLISGHEKDKEIFIPTKESIYEIFPKGSGWSVANLKNKIRILGNNIIIGWYGNFLAAKIIIKELRKKIIIIPYRLTILINFFRSVILQSLLVII
jgi:hypothetical protein